MVPFLICVPTYIKIRYILEYSNCPIDFETLVEICHYYLQLNISKGIAINTQNTFIFLYLINCVLIKMLTPFEIFSKFIF